MYKLRGRTAAVILASTACATAAQSHTQQHAGTKLQAIDRVITARAGQMGDRLPFDACSVYEQSGRPAAMADGLTAGARELLDRSGSDPCAQPAAAALPGQRRIVRVDSVILMDSVAHVNLTVIRGEWSDREQYILRRCAAVPDGDGVRHASLLDCRAIPALARTTTDPPP